MVGYQNCQVYVALMQRSAQPGVTVLIAKSQHCVILSDGLIKFGTKALTRRGSKTGARVTIIAALIDYKRPRETSLGIHFGIGCLSVVPVEQTVGCLEDTATTI